MPPKIFKKLEKPAKVLEPVSKEDKAKEKDRKDKAKEAKENKEKTTKAPKKMELKVKEHKVIKKDKRKTRHKSSSYCGYILKVLKTVHPNSGGDNSRCNLSSKSMGILDCLAHDLYDRLSEEAIRLTRRQKKRTLTSLEMQTATRLVLPGELAKHAMGDGTKAVLNFQQRDA
uniref:Histone H2B n=1 Tax=Hematodinium sp. SG-2012 TaxID=1263730 RepID=K9NUF6_9DINO|nr:histone H2B [Hematodinium sp. SG-2012]